MLHPAPPAPSHPYRQAGLLYLAVIVTGFFSLGYVPAHTLVPGDPVATAQRVADAEGLYRLGLLADLTLAFAFLLLPFALYRALKSWGSSAAHLMVALAALSFPLALINMGPRLDLLAALQGQDGLPPLRGEALAGAVSRSLQAHRQGLLLQQVCWGAWLIPLGLLVSRGGLRPRALGYLLMAGGLGYLLHVAGTLGWPAYPTSPLRAWIRRPATLAELGTCLALLAAGWNRSSGLPSPPTGSSQSPRSGPTQEPTHA